MKEREYDFENAFIIEKWGIEGVSHFCNVGVTQLGEDRKFINLLMETNTVLSIKDSVDSNEISNFVISKSDDNKPISIQIDSTARLEVLGNSKMEEGILLEIDRPLTAFDLLKELVRNKVDMELTVIKDSGFTNLFGGTTESETKQVWVPITKIKMGNTPNINMQFPDNETSKMNIIHIATHNSGKMVWEILTLKMSVESYREIFSEQEYAMCVIHTQTSNNQVIVTLDMNMLIQEAPFEYVQNIEPLMSLEYQTYAYYDIMWQMQKLMKYISNRRTGKVIENKQYIYPDSYPDNIASLQVSFKPDNIQSIIKISELEALDDMQLDSYIKSWLAKPSTGFYESVARNTLYTLYNGRTIEEDLEYQTLKRMIEIYEIRYSATINSIFKSGKVTTMVGTLEFDFK